MNKEQRKGKEKGKKKGSTPKPPYIGRVQGRKHDKSLIDPEKTYFEPKCCICWDHGRKSTASISLEGVDA
jgi:hypothetical protein